MSMADALETEMASDEEHGAFAWLSTLLRHSFTLVSIAKRLCEVNEILDETLGSQLQKDYFSSRCYKISSFVALPFCFFTSSTLP